MWTTLSDGLVAAYVDQPPAPAQNSERSGTKAAAHAGPPAQRPEPSWWATSATTLWPGTGLLEKLSRDADGGQRTCWMTPLLPDPPDRLHATNHATTQDLDGLRHQALHAGTAFLPPHP
ncbi:hypothetical protein ZWY2020_032669 [Hordeum vulgare]|nr:hypothetical protein ZWY2020_032669 [Hordeum vulgare]